jgi:hypothetical protein
MQVDELIIEVRDPELNRIGQFRPEDLVGATFVLRYNNVGSWQMKLPYGNRLGEFLRLPGYGIIVTGPADTVIFSGPTISATLQQTSDNLQGDWEIIGASDDIILQERLAYPTPGTDDVTAQVTPYDERSGPAESVLKQYVNVNLGPSAPVSRQVPGLLVQTDAEQGLVVTGKARFDQLQELFYDIAQLGGIGYKIEQNNGDLLFSCYVPTDRTATVRMDMDNQKLSSSQYSYSSAKVTRVIVGGQGEDEWRRFVEASNTDSEDAETAWGRRIEVFKDGRNSRDLDILQQSGQELLVDQGKTIVEMSVTPSDDINMKFGVDWYLGDKVTIVVQDIEAKAVVTEIGIGIGEDGVRIGATVGAPIGMTYETKLLGKTADAVKRISNLERTITGYGINTPYQPGGGTDGTQPTWTGNPIVGSFNRFGNMVHFNIFVDFDTITSFGTGRYFVTLPYPSLHEIKFADACLHDVSTNREYQMRGSVLAGSDVLRLSTTGISGQSIFDADFTSTAPVTLTTDDYFHIAGTYEIEG